MFEDTLNQRFAGLQTEFNRNLYRYFVLKRDLAKVEEDLNRIEASLSEIERVRKDLLVEQAKETQDKKIGEK